MKLNMANGKDGHLVVIMIQENISLDYPTCLNERCLVFYNHSLIVLSLQDAAAAIDNMVSVVRPILSSSYNLQRRI